jgi:UDP-N-acetylmuramoyl-tripeptide--D-alanyl-D-alanine ligase
MSTVRLTLADVLEGLTGSRPEGLDQLISATVIDSRRVEPGALFVALKGESADGHDYVAEAFSRGAVAAIVERDVKAEAQFLDVTALQVRDSTGWSLPLVLKTADSLQALQQAAAFWRQRHDVRVIGITGSVGKTTTKELAAAVLARRYVTLKSEASYNNEVGLPLTLLHLTDEHERVVLEMGMYDVGEIADLVRIARPHVGIVTIIGPVHLERAGTIERIVAPMAWRFSTTMTSECGGWRRRHRRVCSPMAFRLRRICGPMRSKAWGWRGFVSSSITATRRCT